MRKPEPGVAGRVFVWIIFPLLFWGTAICWACQASAQELDPTYISRDLHDFNDTDYDVGPAEADGWEATYNFGYVPAPSFGQPVTTIIPLGTDTWQIQQRIGDHVERSNCFRLSGGFVRCR